MANEQHAHHADALQEGEPLDRIESLEAELASLRRDLAHAERLATLGTMSSMVAHEFNNILTPVLSYAQMALGNERDQAFTRKALQKALDGAEQASEIAAAILGYSRQAGSDEVDPIGTPGQASVRGSLEQALTCLARAPEKDGIAMSVQVEEGLDAAIAPVALQHILLNLVLNARCAMLGNEESTGTPRGSGGRLNIRAHALDTTPAFTADGISSDGVSAWSLASVQGAGDRAEAGSNGWVAIEIEDTGCGMSRAQLEQIFEPFFTNRKEGHGSGLGLVACSRLTHEVGGRIIASSREGVGTRMMVVLPCAPVGIPTAAVA